MTLTKSTCGTYGRPMFVSGYKFYQNQSRGVKIHWRCSGYAKHGCRAVLHTLQDEITFVRAKGRPLLISGYKFYQNKTHGAKIHWRCSGYEIRFTKSTHGRPIIIASGYRFYLTHHRRGVKIHWRCSGYAKHGCRAVLHTLEDDIRISKSRKGNTLIIADGYTFNKKQAFGCKIHWRCVGHYKGCRAVIHTLVDMTVIKCYNVHSCQCTFYNIPSRTSCGVYRRV